MGRHAVNSSLVGEGAEASDGTKSRYISIGILEFLLEAGTYLLKGMLTATASATSSSISLIYSNTVSTPYMWIQLFLGFTHLVRLVLAHDIVPARHNHAADQRAERSDAVALTNSAM
jgi:hypothetical protein